MRYRFGQADGRGSARLKWTVTKTEGPLVLFGELVQKRMIRTGFPVEYEVAQDAHGLGESLLFVNGNGETELFLKTLALAVAVVARDKRIEAECYGASVALVGAYTLAFRYAKGKAKPSAAEFRKLAADGEVPF